MATLLTEFVKQLSRNAAARQNEIAGKLLNHKVADWDEYNRMTGLAAGLSEAVDMAYQLMKARDLTDDESPLGDMPMEGDGK